jgi:hypothetical protein
MLPGRGVLYSFEIITLLGFFVGVAKNKIKNTNWLFIWLLLAPVPAALSIGPGFAANRAAIMMPALQIISATGALFIFNQITPFLTNPHRNNLFKLSIVAILLTSFIFFAEDYWYQQPAKGSRAMLYGTREIFNHVKENQDNYDEIIIARRISEPHIFAMFYLKLDPKLVQNTTKNWQFEEQGLTWVDQMPVYHLDKFTFKDFNYDAEIAHSGKLLIGPPEMFPADINKDKIITYPYGSDAYWIVSTTSEAFAAKN